MLVLTFSSQGMSKESGFLRTDTRHVDEEVDVFCLLFGCLMDGWMGAVT